jgi:hypothetical protein
MVNITAAITESSIFQKMGLDIKREAARAPKPIVENQTTLATAATNREEPAIFFKLIGNTAEQNHRI